jgi:ribosomal-protein-alanine N-acetyltransferase
MIRMMTKEDLPVIAEMEKDLFPESPWPEYEFLQEMEHNPFSVLAVYEEGGEILGYMDYWITYEQAQLANIAVARKAWGKGIGSRLMDECVRQAEKAGCEVLSLEVRVSNERAVKLYEKYGFIRAAVRKGYYENGEDAHLMIKPLGGLSDDTDLSY